MEPTARNYDEDVFGNKSSTRKRANFIIKFTCFLIAVIVLPLVIRMSMGQAVALDWTVVGFLAFIILTLFTAALAPQAFVQSKEWMAFLESLKK